MFGFLVIVREKPHRVTNLHNVHYWRVLPSATLHVDISTPIRVKCISSGWFLGGMSAWTLPKQHFIYSDVIAFSWLLLWYTEHGQASGQHLPYTCRWQAYRGVCSADSLLYSVWLRASLNAVFCDSNFLGTSCWRLTTLIYSITMSVVRCNVPSHSWLFW